MVLSTAHSVELGSAKGSEWFACVHHKTSQDKGTIRPPELDVDATLAIIMIMRPRAQETVERCPTE